MYGSQVLRKVVRILYQSYPWTAAIKLHHIGPAVGDDEPHQVLPSAHWEFFPPISFVAFAATAVCTVKYISHVTDNSCSTEMPLTVSTVGVTAP